MHSTANGHDLREASISKLGECLQAELSAVDTYELAVASTRDRELQGLLRLMRDSHERRAILVWSELVAAGGDPPGSSGVWGIIARAVQKGADLLAEHWALTGLVDGEDRTTRLYAEAMEVCDAATRAFIENQLLPEQRNTRDVCASLKQLVES